MQAFNKKINGYEGIDRNMFFEFKESSRTRGHNEKILIMTDGDK